MSWLSRRRRERDLKRELQDHLELEAAAQQDAGLLPGEALKAARRAFGNQTLIQEVTREMWAWTSLEKLLQDVRYAVRMLRKSPGFAAVAVLSLGLGIGANTAIFSLLNVVVLRELPVPDPQQLVQFSYTMPGPPPNNWNSWMGYPQYERFHTQARTLGIFAGAGVGRVNLVFRGVAGMATGDAYTDNFFSVMKLTPQLGRLFIPGDDVADGTAAVLNDRYWRSRFGADPSIVGQTVTVNQVPFLVVGVTQPQFSGISVGSAPDFWIPLHALERLRPDPKRWTASFSSWMLIAGRLRPEASLAQSQAELDVLHRQLIAEQLAESELRSSENMQRFVRESHLVLRPAAGGTYSGVRETYSLPLKLLMGVSGIVVLIACANVANLLLARASNRRREIALRLALGAGRTRVVRQLLTEGILLAALGGALAVALSWWGTNALVRMISTGERPMPLDVRPDWQVFGFASGISLLTGILFGLAPAVRGTRVDPGSEMKEGSRHTGRSSRLPDRLLVVAQVALSLVLIAGAGLFARTLQNLWSVDMGFDREDVLMFSVNARFAGHSKENAAPLYGEILQKLQSLPEVRSASASFVRPVDDQAYFVDGVQEVDGRKLSEKDRIRVAYNVLAPSYFQTIGMPILLGRDFNLRDNRTAPKVVIVNESLARKALPDQNPIGHKLGAATIVGVVKDAHYNGARDQPRPVLYHPLFQADLGGDVSFEVRHRQSVALLPAVRQELATIDRALPIFRVKTLRTQAAESLLRERLLATLSSVFGGLALLLACLGLYGLMAYAVARRTSEIGIRLALGAGRKNVIAMVLRETLLLALAGIAAGVPLAIWMAGYVKTLLFGVTPADPLTIGAAAAILIGVAALAGYLPARRASRVDPMVALRYE